MDEHRTVQSVFDTAIRLMDEQNESTGVTETVDTKVYKLRTCSILNAQLDEVYPASDNYPRENTGKRPICPKVSTMEDVIQLDEYLCTAILPYALAGGLLSEENPGLANYFWQVYQERLAKALYNVPAVESEITNVYGGIEKGEFGDW